VSTSASVVFSAFASAADPRLQGWLSLRGHLQVDAVATARPPRAAPRGDSRGQTATDGVAWARPGIWRLLASNSRELGRSSSVYPTFGLARAHVIDLQAGVDRMVATTVTGPTSGTHGWVVTVDDVAVMTSGRWYGTTSTTRDACAGALAALRTALVTDDPRRLVAPGGRRPRRSAGDPETTGSW
jgi:hypothetical protein